MSTRVWRQLLNNAYNPSVPAGQSVLRFALVMLAMDPRATLTPAQREWLTARLQYAPDWQPFTAHEQQRLRAPLLAYLQTYYPRVAAMVSTHFEEDTHAS